MSSDLQRLRATMAAAAAKRKQTDGFFENFVTALSKDSKEPDIPESAFKRPKRKKLIRGDKLKKSKKAGSDDVLMRRLRRNRRKRKAAAKRAFKRMEKGIVGKPEAIKKKGGKGVTLVGTTSIPAKLTSSYASGEDFRKSSKGSTLGLSKLTSSYASGSDFRRKGKKRSKSASLPSWAKTAFGGRRGSSSSTKSSSLGFGRRPFVAKRIKNRGIFAISKKSGAVYKCKEARRIDCTKPGGKKYWIGNPKKKMPKTKRAALKRRIPVGIYKVARII